MERPSLTSALISLASGQPGLLALGRPLCPVLHTHLSLSGRVQAVQWVRQGMCVPHCQGHQEGDSQGEPGPGEGAAVSLSDRRPPEPGRSPSPPVKRRGQTAPGRLHTPYFLSCPCPWTHPWAGRWEELGQLGAFSHDPPRVPWAQAQKENYRQEKKRATRQLLSALTDPSVVIMADSLKVGDARPPATQDTGQRAAAITKDHKPGGLKRWKFTSLHPAVITAASAPSS